MWTSNQLKYNFGHFRFKLNWCVCVHLCVLKEREKISMDKSCIKHFMWIAILFLSGGWWLNKNIVLSLWNDIIIIWVAYLISFLTLSLSPFSVHFTDFLFVYIDFLFYALFYQLSISFDTKWLWMWTHHIWMHKIFFWNEKNSCRSYTLFDEHLIGDISIKCALKIPFNSQIVNYTINQQHFYTAQRNANSIWSVCFSFCF